eukprot:4202426-Pyramimonas_sp.AAC.2
MCWTGMRAWNVLDVPWDERRHVAWNVNAGVCPVSVWWAARCERWGASSLRRLARVLGCLLSARCSDHLRWYACGSVKGCPRP